MKKVWLLIIFLLIAINVSVQMTVSGILDSTISMTAGAAGSSDFTCGFEEFANIRFHSRLRDNRGTVYGAVNLIAAAGDYAVRAASSYTEGENYIAAIELERLYFRLSGEHTNFDAGLFRLPFGFGQVFGPSDYLNPRNPLKPDARPRGILGNALTWFPNDDVKLLIFYSAPRNPFSNEGKGAILGLSMDRHWEKTSIQTLYSFEMPDTFSEYGIHRAGLSLKADIEIGFVIDTLYTYNHEAGTEIDGLSFSAGLDYSFLDGNLIVLTEYLYNGETSSTAFCLEKNILGFPNRHYIYTGLTWRFNDFTNLSAALVTSFEDSSYTPIITLNHDLFQGAVLTVSVQAPFDNNSFYGILSNVRIRLRF